MEFDQILLKQQNELYYKPKELKYGNKCGVFLSPFAFNEYLKYKDDLIGKNEFLYDTHLLTFNHKSIYFMVNNELLSVIKEYLDQITLDLEKNDLPLSIRFFDSIKKSRIYSEIEGTLNVENVPTTRKHLIELIENKKEPKTDNDIIIKNMSEAFDYIITKPAFNKENLFKLYNILSKDCLDEDDILREGDYYRYDSVDIDRYHGAPANMVEECMDSLFNYINNEISNSGKYTYLLPHIAHYYILYIHPYFDYNGRTARMVSLWIQLLTTNRLFPGFISEAINQTKKYYYEALENTRDCHNDITYFLLYVYKVSNLYYLTYQNVDAISSSLKQKGVLLTETEMNYIKKILITYDGPFTWDDFVKDAQIEITKQGALKILNYFVELSILKEVETKSKNKLFDSCKEIIPYNIDSRKL